MFLTLYAPADTVVQHEVKENTGYQHLNPLSANAKKWSNTFEQFVGKLPANCLSVCDHFVGLALKALNSYLAN